MFGDICEGIKECVGCGRPDTEFCEQCQDTARTEGWRQDPYILAELWWDEIKEAWVIKND